MTRYEHDVARSERFIQRYLIPLAQRAEWLAAAGLGEPSPDMEDRLRVWLDLPPRATVPRR